MEYNAVEQNGNKKISKKRKILIFSCHGGGGHMSAAKAIEYYLDDFEVKTVDALGGVLARLDPLYYLSFGHWTGQDFYNFLLRRNKKRTTNLFFHFGYFMRNLIRRPIYNTFLRSIEREKPDIIVSLIPLVSHFFADIAKKKNIPFLLIPTDLDIYSFIRDVSLIDNKRAAVCLGFDCPEITECIQKQFIPAKKVKVVGFPIRKEFFEKKNSQAIKKRLSIPDDQRPVIMLVMGATGSTASLHYIRELKKITTPFHLIICVGRSMYLHDAITKISFPPNMSYSIFNGNSDISDAMTIADLCITKPGSVTFSEVLYMNVPVIVDNTTPALLWERMNLDLVRTYKFGEVITTYGSIQSVVTRWLGDKQLRVQAKKHIAALKKRHFGQELKQLVEEILQ